MRAITYILLGLIALCLVIVGFANHDPVTLTLLPGDIARFTKFNAQIALPLYAVVLGGVAIGLLLGFFWEWVREAKHRSDAVAQRREKARLASEIKKLKADRNEGRDDVLVLLDEASGAR